MNLESIETLRLIGRRPTAGDFELLSRLFQDANVTVTLGGVRSDEQVKEMLDAYLAHWNCHGFGRLIWHNRHDGRFVASAGVRNLEVCGRNEIELGYALTPDFWGQGLATEIAAASVNLAFQQLSVPDVVTFTLPTNLASRRVMEKCGFVFERDFVWKDLPHVLYRLKR